MVGRADRDEFLEWLRIAGEVLVEEMLIFLENGNGDSADCRFVRLICRSRVDDWLSLVKRMIELTSLVAK